MPDTLVDQLEELAASTVELARARGADGAEVVVRDGIELTAKVRLGEPELVQEAGSRALGLRVFVGGRAAVTYTSDMRTDALSGFVSETIALAELSEPDELNRLPEKSELATEVRELDLWDEDIVAIEAADALRWAIAGEQAARSADPRVTNSEGATFSRTAVAMAMANTLGFVGGYRGTAASLSVEPICDDDDGKKRNGYWWTASRYRDGLDDAEAVGVEAARRTVARLGERKVETCEVPIVFDPEVGRSLIGMVFSVANGASFYRRSTYLIEREGTRVASPLVSIVDDPLIARAPGSRPVDGDGLPTRVNVVVRDGVLETVLCDVYSARKLGRRSTGSAGRGIGGNPAPTTSNLIMQPGELTREEMIGKTERGLYVTSMMGFGFNPVTGDFSRGASGFWIEGGELTFPVSEVTVSANFDDLLQRIDMVGSDLDRRSSIQCPTVRVSRMTIGGR